MVWIIDEAINKVRQVGLGSQAMMDAKNVYLDESEAKDVFRATCKHPTRLANSKTRRVIATPPCNPSLHVSQTKIGPILSLGRLV